MDPQYSHFSAATGCWLFMLEDLYSSFRGGCCLQGNINSPMGWNSFRLRFYLIHLNLYPG